MASERLKNIPGFSIDRVAAQAGNDPDVLRLENLDTDLRPPQAALEATRIAIDDDDANSYLPFTGTTALCETVAKHVSTLSGIQYAPTQALITCGGTEGMFDALLATTDPGDEVILTDPTYAGMIYRVTLAGAVPKLVPFVRQDGHWALDLNRLEDAVTERTKAMFIMSPSMPSGAVLNREAWNEVARLCEKHDLWLIYNAAMERILYDRVEYIHPASLDGMADRTITIGSVSKEYRMIGWRVGWVVGPRSIMGDVARAHIYNVVTPTGISQAGAKAALETSADDVANAVAEWQRRRDEVMNQLNGLPVTTADGCWSLLIDVGQMGFDSFAASERLMKYGKVAATPMRDWGIKNSDQFVRFVFSNEPVDRLSTLHDRVQRALAST
jgi:aspartate/methionine/tyrosine aminotransferase